jgi:hypothetical protein
MISGVKKIKFGGEGEVKYWPRMKRFQKEFLDFFKKIFISAYTENMLNGKKV